MAKPIEQGSGETPASEPKSASKSASKSETKSELPMVESPPLSPGSETPAIAVDAPEPALAEPPGAPEIEMIETNAPAASPRFAVKFKARHKRMALLAATVMLAAGIGAVVGAVATGGFAPPVPKDTAALHERDALQKSIARLNKEIATLKTNVATANKAAHSQIAKIADRLNDRIEHGGAPETTGSVPTPVPRPSVAMLESRPPARPPLLKDWIIRDARNGYVYVQGHGDIYQVVPGAALPGLGPVQSITRQEGRWVVLTPTGIIVSMRDRPFFE